jgi:hypothetical protein
MIKVNKKINLEQLDKELNGLGLIASVNEAKEITEVGLAENNPATEAELKSAVEAHKPLVEPELTPKEVLLKRLGITAEEASLLLA